MEDTNTPPAGTESQVASLLEALDSLRREVRSGDQQAAVGEMREQLTALKGELDAHLTPLRQEIAALRQSATQNDSEIDALQIQAAKATRAWYHDPTVLVSFLALFFSFGTTAVSYYRTVQQDVHDARAELRSFLQRLNALPKENMEALKQEDKLAASTISSLINAETSLISSQAVEVMARIPSHISAVEYLVVANAMASSGNYAEAERLMKLSIAASKNTNEAVGALRSYGFFLFSSGNLEAGRQMYQQALDIHSKYPTKVTYYENWTNALTELNWASAELSQRQCAEAQEHLRRSAEIVSGLQPGQATDLVGQQVQGMTKNVAGCK